MKFIKYIVFVLFISILLIEKIQGVHKFIDAPPLQGNFANAPKPTFTISNWLEGKYQDSLLKNHESTLSIHNFLIRLHNQIDYSVFGKINVKGTEEGKDHYFFGTSYSTSFLGEDYIGEKKISERVKKLAYIQHALKKQNTELICVIAPGKSSFMSENLSSKYDVSKKQRSNYDAYVQQFILNDIQHIDLVSYFQKEKTAAAYPLFTQCGIHWSGYGSTRAADTLFRYMENIKHIDIKDFYSDGGQESEIPLMTDGDITNAMNLLCDIPFHKMYYPNIVFKDDTSKMRPNTLIIGDSFVWSWISFYDYFPNLLDKKSVFWYYAQEIGWPADLTKPFINVDRFDFNKETNNRDFILIVCNESKLYDFGFGFVDKLYDKLQKDSMNLY